MRVDPGAAEARLSDSTIVAICNQKGGVGKTLCTLGLCAHTAHSHGRALGVDVDPQANLYDVTQALRDPGYDVLHELNPAALKSLRELRNYDTIYVDCPGSLEGRDVLDEVLEYADYAIIPYDHEPTSVAPTLRTVEFVKERRTPYGVLLNNVDPRLGEDHIKEAFELLDGAGVHHFRTVVRHYRVWSTSLRDGYPITRATGRYAPHARQDIASVSTELLLELRRAA
jgi:chromosome partitioning protein